MDSDWVADYLKGRQHAVQFLDSLFRDGMAISIITFAEIYEGIYYGSDPKRNEGIFARFLQGVDVLGINRPVARRFAMVRGALREAGQLIPQPDIFIAATALHRAPAIWLRRPRSARACAASRYGALGSSPGCVMTILMEALGLGKISG